MLSLIALEGWINLTEKLIIGIDLVLNIDNSVI